MSGVHHACKAWVPSCIFSPNFDRIRRDTSYSQNCVGARGTYPKGNRGACRTKEQQAMNDRGGFDKLDNKRNEVAPKNWPDKKIEPPKKPPKEPQRK
jgi:hypothetical protein